MERKHIILKTLDNQPRVLFWGLDEFLIMAVPFIVGLLFQGGFGVFLMIFGFLLKPLYSKFKRRSRYFSWKAFIYWNIPKKKSEKLLGIKNFPDSSARELLL